MFRSARPATQKLQVNQQCYAQQGTPLNDMLQAAGLLTARDAVGKECSLALHKQQDGRESLRMQRI